MTIQTQNRAWGFFGTLCQAGLAEERAAALYDDYARDVLVGKYGLDEADAVEFLDSRIGRHLADCFVTRGDVRIDHEPSWLAEEIRRYFAKRANQ